MYLLCHIEAEPQLDCYLRSGPSERMLYAGRSLCV